MKKILPVIIVAVCAVITIIGCVCWYQSVTKVQIGEQSGDTNIVESGENIDKPISNEPIFSLENYPVVDASLAIHPLVDSIASNFLGISEQELNFEYSKGRTSDVYKNLIDGTADVIFAAEPSEGDLEYAKSKGVELEIIPTTSSAFVFVVNSENPVDDVKLEEIVKIYKGEITNWKELGGEDATIIPFQRPDGSGSQTAMISLVMKDESLMTAPTIKVVAGMDELVDAVAEYDNSKTSIGYSYFYYINTMYKRDTIKMLAINGVEPNLETIKNGTYPVYTNGYIVIKKSATEESPERKWVNAVLSERGSKIIEDAGYVPVN